jgi:hypothetical protein
LTASSRGNPRVPVRLSAEVRVGERTFTGVTRNLSLGGVCLEGELSLPEGAPLTVGLFLVIDDVEDATRPPLEITGKVAWITAEGRGRSILGVRFDRLAPFQTAGLTKFLNLVGAD